MQVPKQKTYYSEVNMKNTILRKATAIIASAACLGGMFMTVSADTVEISDSTFPDEAFRTYVENSIDKDGDKVLSQAEMDSVTSIMFDKKGAANLKGIEYFTQLNRLECEENKVTELDLSNNKNITYLNVRSNKLKKLDVSMLKLSHLECSDNQITALDVSKSKDLDHLECNGNKIADLDITANKNLQYLICYSNAFTTLDISKCPKLVLCYTDGDIFEFGPNDDPIIRWAYNNSLLSISKSLKLVTGLADVDGIAFDLDNEANNADQVRVRCGTKARTTVEGSNGNTVTWKTSDKSIATVDASGVITGKKAGLVKITATCGSKSATREVRILYKDLTDTSTFWYTPTYYLTDLGVVKGYDNQTKFKAANNCTRAQMVTFIWRLKGCPEPTTSNCKFGDVKKTDYFYKACLWGNENHIVEGYKDDTFRPQTICDRRHAVTFLWRLAGCPEPSSTVNKFEDVKESDYYYKPTLWASELKILEGYGDGTFRPDNHCLRRQMTTFLYKYDKYVNGNG